MEQPACVSCGDPATEVSLIGPLCGDCFRYVEPTCDFCSVLQPAWRYPARDFLLPSDPDGLINISRSDWLACDICHRMIEADDWSELAAYSLGKFRLGNAPRSLKLLAVRALHSEFKINRTGPAIRIGSA